MNMQRTSIDDLLVGGLDDWADIGWVAQFARLSGVGEGASLRHRTLATVAEVLTKGLMVAGDVVAGEFRPWQLSTADAIARISRSWIEEWGAHVPTPGAIAWLSNTQAGDDVARAVLAREKV